VAEKRQIILFRTCYDCIVDILFEAGRHSDRGGVFILSAWAIRGKGGTLMSKITFEVKNSCITLQHDKIYIKASHIYYKKELTNFG
jgi:hypothetical protein